MSRGWFLWLAAKIAVDTWWDKDPGFREQNNTFIAKNLLSSLNVFVS